MITRKNRWLYILAAAIFVNSVLVNLALPALAPEPHNDTLLQALRFFLAGASFGDSFKPMAAALDYFRNVYLVVEGATPLYSEIFFEQGVKFQYPPITLLFQQGVDAVNSIYGGGFENALNWVLVVAAAIANVLIFRAASPTGLSVGERPLDGYFLALMIFGASLLYFPMLRAFELGQVQVWINALFGFALLALLTGRSALAGALMAVAALLKPHYVLILIWALLRGDRSFAVACAGVLAVSGVVSLAVFGWTTHVDYLHVVSFIGERGEAFFPNQSLNGLLNRLMSLSDPDAYNNLLWRADHFPPRTGWIVALVTLFSLAMLASASAKTLTARDDRSYLDFCLFTISLTLASPIAWEHHWGILSHVIVLLFAMGRGDRTAMIWLAVAYVLSTNYWSVLNVTHDTVLNPLQSYLFFAALICLGLLYRASGGLQPVIEEARRLARRLARLFAAQTR